MPLCKSNLPLVLASPNGAPVKKSATCSIKPMWHYIEQSKMGAIVSKRRMRAIGTEDGMGMESQDGTCLQCIA